MRRACFVDGPRLNEMTTSGMFSRLCRPPEPLFPFRRRLSPMHSHYSWLRGFSGIVKLVLVSFVQGHQSCYPFPECTMAIAIPYKMYGLLDLRALGLPGTP